MCNNFSTYYNIIKNLNKNNVLIVFSILIKYRGCLLFIQTILVGYIGTDTETGRGHTQIYTISR